MQKAIFLDRDGVINELICNDDLGVIESPFKPEQLHLLPGAAKAISMINNLGFKAIVITNQPGIARGYFTEEILNRINAKMKRELAREGASLDAVYYCPHLPEGRVAEYNTVCDCRKPKPGLILQAAQDFDISLPDSYMIGDSAIDIEAGTKAGCHPVLLGGLKCGICRMMEKRGCQPYFIAANLLEAVTVIKLNMERKDKTD